MQEKHLKLIAAGENDIPLIARLARQIWNAHYIPIIGKEQVDYMLNLMYSAESLEEQMTRKHHLFFLIMNGQTVSGFVSLHEEKKSEWFLNKFYILESESAKGLGTSALKKLIETTGAEKITLTVNRQNFKSINFYFKNGFTIHHVEDFDIGQGYVMNDFVMEWTKA